MLMISEALDYEESHTLEVLNQIVETLDEEAVGSEESKSGELDEMHFELGRLHE